VTSPESTQLKFEPLAEELSFDLQVDDALAKFEHLPGCLLMESSMQIDSAQGNPLGRYSFLMADPFKWLRFDEPDPAAIAELQKLFETFRTHRMDGLPPMQGGIAGLISYDFNRAIEKIAPAKIDEFKTPAVAMGCYDVIVAWDHIEEKCWLISQGFPETDVAKRSKRARSRLDQFTAILNSATAPKMKIDTTQIPASSLAPQFPTIGLENLTSNFSRDDYLQTVEKCIEYIHAGDIFQVNLAQRLLLPATDSSHQLYHRMRRRNPAPFSAYFDFGGFGHQAGQLISASPERLVSVRKEIVETRPIKGTRPRTSQPLVDIEMKRKLESSEKDLAENTMIVDLMRNDLSKVCEDDSIRVTQLCKLENYQSVMHLVSAVEGKLRSSDALRFDELIAAVFPGGSITGAPKVRAMEIIAELEPTARGAYCGSLGYLSFSGDADLNILIRTITSAGGWWQIPVGGGIVSQSNPSREYEETWTKAASLLHATIE
jgi:para-aminobenzoate synthetase component 1